MKGWYIIAYDIRDPRRLKRAYYYVSKHALRIQYSVYLLQVNRTVLTNILQELKEKVDDREDDVRVYPVPGPTTIWAAGTQKVALTGLYSAKKQGSVKQSKWKRIIRRLFG